MRRPKFATLMTFRKPMWHHTKIKRLIQEIKNHHFTNWWHLSHFPWTTAFTRMFATSILWCYNFNGMIKWYDISCAILYIANGITHFTRTALHDSRQRSDFIPNSSERMFPCSSFMYCCHPEPFAHQKQQGSDLANTEHSVPLLTVLLLRDFRNNACKFLLCEQLHVHADNCTESRNRTGVYKLC